MASIASTSRVVIGGIYTHKDLHVAAVLDTAGVLLGTEAFHHPRRPPCLVLLSGFGDVRLVGIEGHRQRSAPGSPATRRGRHRRSPRPRPARPLRTARRGGNGTTPSTPRNACPGPPPHLFSLLSAPPPPSGPGLAELYDEGRRRRAETIPFG